MSFLAHLERRFGRYAISNLSMYLVMGQVAVLLAAMFQLIEPQILEYAPVTLRIGQWWRVVTFIFVPTFPSSTIGYVFLVFGWYMFYLMGGALESYWGAFRFNAFIFMSFAFTVALTWLAPMSWVTNTYILGSVFLAFAYLNPDFEFRLYMILPVKAKWLAMLTWAIYAAYFVVGNRSTKLQIVASVATFVLFFGGDIARRLGMRQGGRSEGGASRRSREKEPEEDEPRHRCYVCGKTDRTHPQMDFRYCSKCAGDQCYCEEHIRNHVHVTSANEPQKK